MSITYADSIPNNVDLAGDKVLQRALEHWQPEFLNWWADMGPENSQSADVYLRTAVSVHPSGWAHFDYVKMPEYRWGIFLSPADGERRVNFGDHKGEPAWQDVPGEHRANLRRIIVTQGDTEPASVEQQRHLGLTCPSLYDLRNLFQVNVEEGRHLWAMVYLLHRYFGRDGREEAEALLQRRSGDRDNPRILGAFNEKTPDWLAFFMFTYFTDRDGKFQLCALAESGFDPLARTTRFMLMEEAHHMYVGESGVARVIQRTCEVMAQHKTDDPTRAACARRHRSAYHPALPEFSLQCDHRSVRRRRVIERCHVLFERSEGPVRGNQIRGRSPAAGCDLSGIPGHRWTPHDRRGTRPQRPQREAARRLHQGLRRGRGTLEPRHPKERNPVRIDRAAQGVQSEDRAPGGAQGCPRRARGERGGMALAPARMAGNRR